MSELTQPPLDTRRTMAIELGTVTIIGKDLESTFRDIIGRELQPLIQEITELKTSVDNHMKALVIFSRDPHQFSTRPCVTCQTVSTLVGYDFGCVKSRKRE